MIKWLGIENLIHHTPVNSPTDININIPSNKSTLKLHNSGYFRIITFK